MKKTTIPMTILCSTIACSAALTYFIIRKKQKDSFYVKSYDKKFEIKFPNNWRLSKEKNELNENSNLEITNNEKGLCLIMFSKNKKELNNITLDEYNQNTVNGIKENNVIVSSKKNIIHKKEVYVTEFYSNYKEVDVHYFIYVLETENYYHQFMIAYMGNKNYSNNINRIISTLKEI